MEGEKSRKWVFNTLTEVWSIEMKFLNHLQNDTFPAV